MLTNFTLFKLNNFKLLKNCFNKISFVKSNFINTKNFSFEKKFLTMNSTVPPTVINPDGVHKSTLFFFHGYGDNGDGWAEALDGLKIKNLKIVCPSAPSLKVTLNNGKKIPAWFDILALDSTASEDKEGIHKAKEYVYQLIQKEIDTYQIPSEKIFLGGFSQGGALALYSGLTIDKKLAGLLIFSAWLPLRDEFPGAENSINQDISIFQCHGDLDFIVPLNWAEASLFYIKEKIKFKNVNFVVYNSMAHCTCAEQLRNTKEFVEKLIAKF